MLFRKRNDAPMPRTGLSPAGIKYVAFLGRLTKNTEIGMLLWRRTSYLLPPSLRSLPLTGYEVVFYTTLWFRGAEVFLVISKTGNFCVVRHDCDKGFVIRDEPFEVFDAMAKLYRAVARAAPDLDLRFIDEYLINK
jgi:hypothetical protein